MQIFLNVQGKERIKEKGLTSMNNTGAHSMHLEVFKPLGRTPGSLNRHC